MTFIRCAAGTATVVVDVAAATAAAAIVARARARASLCVCLRRGLTRWDNCAKVDLLDKELLDEVFRVCGDVGFVIHFAALKVGAIAHICLLITQHSLQLPRRLWASQCSSPFVTTRTT